MTANGHLTGCPWARGRRHGSVWGHRGTSECQWRQATAVLCRLGVLRSGYRERPKGYAVHRRRRPPTIHSERSPAYWRVSLIADHIHDRVSEDHVLRISGLGGLDKLFRKTEGFNADGSIELKTRRGPRPNRRGVRCGHVQGPGSIKSTSGNLGVTLAVICTAKQYRLTCVTDPNADATSMATMRTLGAEVVTIRTWDGTLMAATSAPGSRTSTGAQRSSLPSTGSTST